MLTELESLPEGLLDLPCERLHEKLSGPTLLHLPGRREQPLFVSVLLHGNEDTGWEAMRALLAKYQGQELPRALSIFIGNVSAARERMRHLDGQPDFNRIWRGGDSAEAQMAGQIAEIMRRRQVFASIDIHNNTGLNPHYACINVLEQEFLHLATLFSRTVVYFTTPDSVQSRAFSAICPAVTVECGKSGQSHNTAHALEFVEAALHLDHFPEQPLATSDYELFHTVATVKVPADVDFAFSPQQAELVFPEDLDRLNFRELPAGTELGRVKDSQLRLKAQSESGSDVTADYFALDNGSLITRRVVMPSMLTLDERIIRQDCLCYLMERLPALG